MPYRFRIGIKYQYTVSAKKQNTSETKMRGKKDNLVHIRFTHSVIYFLSIFKSLTLKQQACDCTVCIYCFS